MSIAFVDGRVVVGNGRVLERASVLVEGERIVKVAAKNFMPPKDCQRISLKERTLLPGFIDAHVHLCLDGIPDPMTAFLNTPLVVSILKAANFARQTLMAGVTTIRDMGAKDGIDLGLRQAICARLVKPATLTVGAGEFAAPLESQLIGLADGTRAHFDLPAGEGFGQRSVELVLEAGAFDVRCARER